jgi:hypothetical protein
LREEMQQRGTTGWPLPAAFPTIVRGRSPGLWDRAYRLPVSARSQWLGCRPAQSAGAGRLVDTPAHTYRCGGSRGFGRRRPHLFPVSHRREARAGTPRTSPLIVIHKCLGPQRAAGWNLH